ncbi:tubulin-tyrosine ligase [Daedaleopsis nitida]|nr:tubulin-tyrosine ligase [Daedaleopsis nitida]
MADFTAFVSWPSAPLTNRLVRNALNCLSQPPPVFDVLTPEISSAPGRLLQWTTYDALDHDLTFSHHPDSKVLSSSYVIRKALIRKHFLSRCIHNYLTKHPESVLTRGVPRTWELELSFADELDELWGDDLYDLAAEIEKNDLAKWWILKPGMADRGMGLRLFHSKQDLEAIFQEFEQDESEPEDEESPGSSHDTAVVTSQLRHFVIQEYLPNPLLIDPAEVPLDNAPKPATTNLHGHKFHLRVYCVASGAIRVYMYEHILALFSATPYTAPSKEGSGHVAMDLSAHLTNTSLQTERGEAGVRLLDELVGCHVLSSPGEAPRRQQPRPPRAMGRMLDPETFHAERKQRAQEAQEARYPTLTGSDVAELKKQICDVLADTFKAAVDMSVHFQPVPNAFELFGIDFVVTHDPSANASQKYQVKLLEVNSEPAIELTGPRLTWILEDLFKGIAKICVEPFFGQDRMDQTTGIGGTKENLRLCLNLQVRGSQGW